MFGHFAENFISSPDNRFNVAFNLYAMECETQVIMNEARSILRDCVMGGDTFDSIDEIETFVNQQLPNACNFLTYTDYRSLFFEFCN